jgi:hypothetical protein
MGRNHLGWWGLGVAALLAWQPAQVQAGERKQLTTASRHSEMSTRAVPVAALPRSLGADHGTSMRAMHGRTELTGVPVRPLETRLSHQPTTGVPEQGRHEHKSLTFFRLNPKFGDVSVQPVVGGVNGAQVSVGF